MSTTESLLSSVQLLSGVGPERAETLARLGIRTIADLLFCFPRRYQDLTLLKPIFELVEDEPVSVRGIVTEIDNQSRGFGRSRLTVLVSDSSASLRAMWFNQPAMRHRFEIGKQVLLSGKPKRKGLTWEMAHPRVQDLIVAEGEEASGEILPIYPLTQGLTQAAMRRLAKQALEKYGHFVEEALPASFQTEHQLCGITDALFQIHHPASQEEIDTARNRFVFQELLVLQLALAIRRYQLINEQTAIPVEMSAKIDSRVRRLLPFIMTPAQEKAIDEVVADMGRDTPMNRLLQGDVGSGKTVVALYAMLVVVAGGQQAVLMAPTEVLANQHFRTLTKMLANSRVRLALWTGTLGAAQRRETKAKLEAGEIDLVIGTQAIIQGELSLPKLGLVVIDEQHKFGVRQRAHLRDSGESPHYLVMTATPIPRTVAMTVYGDLDVSTMKGFPPGRQEVHTYVVTDDLRARWWNFYREQLRAGRQGFVVTPLLEQSEDEHLVSVLEAYEALCRGELKDFRLQLVHGRMKPVEKQAAMDAFRTREAQVLVATSVVEVGIDIPNAAVMTIENAERFGMASLHQLRGRVGRGQYPGYVALCPRANSEEGMKRVQAVADTRDGFDLAEVDFSMRGPGELLGTKQHGIPPLRIADLQRDHAVLIEARKAAQSLVATDPKLALPEHRGLLRQVTARYAEVITLGDVG
jgi:ATP-dependent DNA helicase RecG